VKQYLEQSQRPWVSLVAIFPLMAIYEAGTRGLLPGVSATSPDQLVATGLMLRGFNQLGATSSWLPALLTASCLLCWHFARRDQWQVRLPVVAGMWVEALLLAMPIALVGVAIFRMIPLSAQSSAGDAILLSIGAGIYEEFVFRLVFFALAHTILTDVLKFKGPGVLVVIVTGSALLFAGYHCLGSEPFTWPAFVFRSVAGVVLGIIMLSRGFGVTVFSHVAYNLILVAVQQQAGFR
jgi:hypothetical protein